MTEMDRHLRASEIFLKVRTLPSHERDQALQAATEHDEALRREVEELLAHDIDDTQPQHNGATGEPSSLLPFGTIGPYQIKGRIGRGSSGHVFLAEQHEPIHRRVAIKVVPQAAINDELAARFDVERRALECTEHPNIARVLDAGRTPDGLPYLVMDYVEGEPITTYCAKLNLRLADRIRLMLAVADAVQHVHQRGVIHRDIKPANILVTEVDGKPVPRVLDFGIAKPISAPGMLAAESPPTSGLPLGTPSYMAPEQTGMQIVDTRADVYALAAVLYELVTGKPPIEGTGDPVDVLNRIRHQVPPPASRVRANSMDARSAPPPSPRGRGAGGEGSTPPSPRGLTARHSSRERSRATDERSESSVSPSLEGGGKGVGERWVEQPPPRSKITPHPPPCPLPQREGESRSDFDAASEVPDSQAQGNAAGPPMATLRGEGLPRSVLTDLDCILACALEKETDRRYPTVSAFAEDLNRLLRLEPIAARPPTLRYRAHRFIQRNRILVGAAALVAITTLAAAVIITFSVLETHRQRIRAIDQYTAQREINRFLTDDLLAAASPEEMGKDVSALDLLNRAAARVDARFPDRPFIAGALHHTLGDAYAVLGAFAEAEHHLTKAVHLRRNAAGPDSADTVHSEIAYASCLARQNKYDDAEPALRAALARAELLLDPADPAIYTCLNDLGYTFNEVGKHEDARNALERALEGRTRLLGENHPKVLVTVSNLAQVYEHLGEQDRSLALMQEALRIAESQPEPSTYLLLGLSNNVGATLQDLGRDLEAAPYIRKAAELANDFLGRGHPATLTIMGNLAGLESDLGDPDHAAELYKQIADERTFLLGKNAPDTLTSRYGYWNARWKGKHFEEAAEGYKELLADTTEALGETHWLTVQTKASLARALLDAGKPAEALPLAEAAHGQFLELFGAEHPRTVGAGNTLREAQEKLRN